MQKIELYVLYDEKGRLILTKKNNYTFVSDDAGLMEFLSTA